MAISTFTSAVLERQQLTSSVILLKLSTPAEFTFKAGQFVTVKITSAGATRLKSYSICNPPRQRKTLDLCIKIVENGFASEIFQKTKSGDSFEIKGPFGHFVFDEASPHVEHWFLGAGTGVVPLYSMIAEHAARFPQKKFVLLFGVKSKLDLFLQEEIRDLLQRCPNFSYHPVLSREEWSGWRGHVQDHLPADVKNKTFYICGLKELVLDAKERLVRLGVAYDDIKLERYD